MTGTSIHYDQWAGLCVRCHAVEVDAVHVFVFHFFDNNFTTEATHSRGEVDLDLRPFTTITTLPSQSLGLAVVPDHTLSLSHTLTLVVAGVVFRKGRVAVPARSTLCKVGPHCMCHKVYKEHTVVASRHYLHDHPTNPFITHTQHSHPLDTQEGRLSFTLDGNSLSPPRHRLLLEYHTHKTRALHSKATSPSRRHE